MIELKEIRIYIYDKLIMKKLLVEVSNELNKKKYTTTSFFLKKGWDHGFHFGIVYRKSDEFENSIYKFIKDKVSEYQSMSSEIDYKNVKDKIEKIAKIEKFKNEFLPIESQFYISIEDFKESYIIRNNLFFQEELIKSEFIIQAMPYYYKLENSEKLIFILELMIVFSDCGFKDDEYEIETSYFSFKSHYEGFKAQLDFFDFELKEKCLNEIDIFTELENDFIKNKFESFIYYVRNGFKGYEGEDKYQLIKFRNLFKQLLIIYKEKIENKEVVFPEEQSIKSFFESNSKNLSVYHNNIKSEFDERFFYSFEFTLGRLITNWFYTMLPMFSISPLQKHKLCNILCNCVERMAGRDSYELIQNYGKAIKEKYDE